ncbi:MAG: hypothetical protein ACJAZ2_001691 [Glaciecola sp.]|jgi:hypothetical protein
MKLIFASLFIASQAMCQHVIKFTPTFGNDTLVFNKMYKSKQNDSLKINSLKLYFSSFVVKYKDGTTYTQTNSYHLLKWDEDHKAKTIALNLKQKPITSISFNLGIDSTMNTAGALDGDLDPILGMYWSWQSGYINFKIEGSSSSCKTHKNEFSFHVGGYLPPNNAVKKITLQTSQQPIDKEINIGIDLSKFFDKTLLAKTNSVTIPSSKAVQAASILSKCFQVK